MADILREITAWTLILTGTATCLSAGAATAALLMHITTQWLWEKLKAAYSLKELSDAVGHGNGRKIPEIQNNDRPE